jgi:arsenite methyltransferase
MKEGTAMADTKIDESTDLKKEIRERYAERAREVSEQGQSASCCGSSSSSCCGPTTVVPNDEFAQGLYSIEETGELPKEAVLASLGCGNPTALAELREGEVVLDLGSGGGIDVLLSARRVGPTGKAYGLDMTDDMLALARENQRRAGVDNVEFLKGEIEEVPLPDESVDVIISNCVINLSLDKDKVLAEAYRVLRPGGHFAVSDMVFRGDLSLVPDAIMKSVEAWGGCIAGALEESDYIAKLEHAGFVDAEVVVTRDYRDDYGQQIEQALGVSLPDDVTLVGAFVRATKPLLA